MSGRGCRSSTPGPSKARFGEIWNVNRMSKMSIRLQTTTSMVLAPIPGQPDEKRHAAPGGFALSPLAFRTASSREVTCFRPQFRNFAVTTRGENY